VFWSCSVPNYCPSLYHAYWCNFSFFLKLTGAIFIIRVDIAQLSISSFSVERECGRLTRSLADPKWMESSRGPFTSDQGHFIVKAQVNSSIEVKCPIYLLIFLNLSDLSPQNQIF